MRKQEFALTDAYSFNREGPVKWIVSHMLKYPYLPLLLVVLSITANLAYSNIQVFS